MGGIFYFNNQWFKERSNYLSIGAEFSTVAFEWDQDVHGDYTEPHSAMLIPVTLEGVTQKCYMQFDTGAPYSLFHGKTLASFQNFGLQYDTITKDKLVYAKDFDFKIGENRINASLVRVMDYGTSVESEETSDTLLIGTIGTDLIEGKVLVIDFRKQTIDILDNRPDYLSRSSYRPFDFKGRRILFPATIKEKKIELLYDSGSSAFGLLTSKDRYDIYTDENKKAVEYNANSWGNSIPIHHKESSQMIRIGGADISLKRVSYVEWNDKLQGFMSKFTKIGGFLGNKTFTESIMIIDTQKQEFAVVKGD